MGLSDARSFEGPRLIRMISTILKVSGAQRNAMGRALQSAGISYLEAKDGAEAARAIEQCSAAVVLCDDELLPPAEAEALAKSITVVSQSAKASLPRDALRSLSHELRTPLSAMSGWIHLMETGALDEAGLKRAITKLRGNIDDQVRTIDRYLGATTHEGQR
jgi:signal transduction histidine kinase